MYKDILYAIVFSIVLLNTDHHIVNVAMNYKRKMPRKAFLKNTLDLIEDMISKDEKIRTDVSLDAETAAKWKKDIRDKIDVKQFICECRI